MGKWQGVLSSEIRFENMWKGSDTLGEIWEMGAYWGAASLRT